MPKPWATGGMIPPETSSSEGGVSAMQEYNPPLYQPEHCPCAKVSCPRNRDCDACRANHHGKGSKTACERRLAAANKLSR